MRHCRQCGKEFAPTKSDHIYCSARCRTEHNIAVQREIRRLKAGPKHCEHCGKIFYPPCLQTKYCSNACRGEAMKEKRRARWRQVKRICKGCAQIFSPTSRNQAYCCEKCRKTYLRARKVEEGRAPKPVDPYFLRRGPTRATNRGYSCFFSYEESYRVSRRIRDALRLRLSRSLRRDPAGDGRVEARLLDNRIEEDTMRKSDNRPSRVTVWLTCTACGMRYRTVVTYAARHVAKKRKYCKACLKDHYQKNAQATKKPKIRACKICGEKFVGYTSGKYCSDECKLAGHNERSRKHRMSKKIDPYFLRRGNTHMNTGDSFHHSVSG